MIIERKNSSDFLKNIFTSDNFGLFMALIVLVVTFSFINPNYGTLKNFNNVLIAASLTGLIAVGESLLLIGGKLDLSPGSTAAFSGVLASLLMAKGISAPIAIALCLLMGACIGAFNAFFTTFFKISPFIVTLASQSIVRGMCYIVSNGESILIRDKSFLRIGTFRLFNVPFPIFFMLLIFIVFYIVLKKMRFGRNIYVVGGNENAARLAGISNKMTTYALFIIMGFLAAAGGLILASRMNTGQPQASDGLEFDGITAAILGGVGMSGGYGSLTGTFIGLMILQGFNNGLIMMNVPSFWQLVAKGGLLLVALSFDYIRTNKRRRKKSLAV